MSFPVLETERLILREITKKDSKAIFDYFSRDDVTRLYDHHVVGNLEGHVDNHAHHCGCAFIFWGTSKP
ncbi:GNAT family N-acetyltransferase [Bacillus mycoides]|uniref:GNAT family N-acetyltransferase n=1 Tax=Bacillus mycoides TaxID=1405 RepID=UPI003D206280